MDVDSVFLRLQPLSDREKTVAGMSFVAGLKFTIRNESIAKERLKILEGENR
jgi:hypothetical protein